VEYTVKLTPPEGPEIQKIYREFVDNFLFPEDLVLGPYDSGKSTMLVDGALLSMLDYPGALIFFAGNTLAKLKRTTLDKLSKRGSLIFESENEREAIYRTPEEPDPWTGKPVQSILRAMGLDKTDVESEMSSTEPFRFFIEEASDVSQESHDVAIARTRGKAYHKTWKNKRLLILKSKIWGNIYGEEIDPKLVLEVLKLERNELHHPMQGFNAVKCADNPRNSHLWTRYVGVPYPKDIITESFVKQFIGVRDIYKTREELQRIQLDFDPGDLVTTADSKRHVVKSLSYHERGDTVTMLDGSTYDANKVLAWGQRRTQYIFPKMNQSRNKPASKSMIYISNSDLAERMMGGKEDREQGRVFSNFINAPIREGGHIIPAIERTRLSRAKVNAYFGVDQGGGHATAAAGAFKSKAHMYTGISALILFYSYLSWGETSSETAENVKTGPTPNMTTVWGADPAMWNRNYAGDRSDDGSIPTYAQRFIDAGIPLMQSSSGDIPYDDVNELLIFRDGFMGAGKTAGLYVFEDQYEVIETLDTLTWKMVRNKRGDWRVDMGDAIKFLVSIYKKYESSGSDMPGDGVIRARSTANLPWNGVR
jgi:hypothetical protein